MKTYEYPPVFYSWYRPQLILVAADTTCSVIDPDRDAGRHIIAAQETDAGSTPVLVTHLHAVEGTSHTWGGY